MPKRNTTRKVSTKSRSKSSKSMSRTRSRSKSATPPPKTFRMKSFVTINKPRWSHNNRVAQVVAVSRDGLRYAVRINYNGYFEIYKASELMIASQSEKKQDKKLHNRDSTISQTERDRLNNY